MGFPVGYSELMLPKFLLQLVFFLGHVRRLISWIFEAMGLGDLLLDTDISIAPSTADYSPAGAAGELYRRRHGGEERSATAALIQEMLPVTLVGDLQTEGWDIPEACAVCLQEFSAGDEVRRPGNCRHIFHRCCLDRWTEHDQRTCPLCRTPLLSEDLRDALDGRIWTAAGESAPSYYEGFDFTGAGEDEPALSLLYRYSPPALVASS